MKKFWKNLFNILKIVNILLFLFLLSACNHKEEIIEPQIQGQIPDEESDSVKIVSINQNFIEQEITAIHIDRYSKLKKIIADTVFVTNYKEDGSIKSTLYCDKANIDDAKNIFTGIGNVIVTSKNGIMKTPYLIWNRNTNGLHAKNGVTLIREDNILYGKEMETNTNLDKIKIIKVSAEGIINEENIDW